jgi:hypothetical protein
MAIFGISKIDDAKGRILLGVCCMESILSIQAVPFLFFEIPHGQNQPNTCPIVSKDETV